MSLGVFKRKIDVDADIQMTPLKSLYASGDKDAHVFELSLYRGEQEMDLSGASAQGYFIRADGYTVPITGAISGNIVTLTLSEGCYYVVGNFNLIIKVSTAESRKAVFWGNGYVVRSMTDAIVDEENVIPSLDELLAQIAAVESAAKAANQAASAANSAATSARQAASAADTNASSANSAANAAKAAATTATEAATKINDMTISANGLAAGAAPTAKLTEVDGHYNIVLGLPKGDKGDPGATPQITVQVKTGEPGTAASVKQTGTAEAPVIELTIPRGDTGSLGSLTINGKTPDSAGKVELTAADVRARADDWMPTAADVGALSGTDATLAVPGKAADAKATGDALNQLKTDIASAPKMIADVWSADKNYSVGDYCIYNNALWRCTVATIGSEHAPTDASAEWVKCTATDEIKSIHAGSDAGFIYLNDNFEYRIKNGYCTLIGRSIGSIKIAAQQYVNLITLPQNARTSTEIVGSAVPLGNNFTIFYRLSIDGSVDIWSYEECSYWNIVAVYPV